MPEIKDGPASPLFKPLPITGACSKKENTGVSEEMLAGFEHAPAGSCVCWGIPFKVGEVVLISGEDAAIEFEPVQARWLVFMHTSDLRPVQPRVGGIISPMRGQGQLGEHAADYVMQYEDGAEVLAPIRRRFQAGMFRRRWGENCFEAVAYHKPYPLRAGQTQYSPGWGFAQTRVWQPDGQFGADWVGWLWAWENPLPEKALIGVRFHPVSGAIVVSAISAGNVSSNPLRWRTRRKARFELPAGVAFEPDLDEHGLLAQIKLDLGQLISAAPQLIYPNDSWEATCNNQAPVVSENGVLVEYTAHPEAHFHLSNGQIIPVVEVEREQGMPVLRPVPPATQRVTLRAVDRSSGKCVPVKLHIHGQSGEYLAPVDRHRTINPEWFEDYSVDFAHFDWSKPGSVHRCTYIPGETTIDLPLGKVYVEVSKGFEIRPVRRDFEITPATREILVEIDKVLPWRENGWVTADTHVHFLSPASALLEGSAEGVNVVNLLASQWGELMTNVGDFDGRTTWGAPEFGGDGEYLVRVGTENRQHVLGHISLLGYNGRIIAPMTTGGPDESALGDPIEILLTEWARQCKKQGGLVVLPHFPNPRAEHAASIVSGEIDAIEMTSWENLYSGIDPYSLSDWYRYLNCGYLVAAVGGTDKMTANTAVGAVRTYARLQPGQPFTYGNWMDAVRRAETFVTYGPLIEFSVDGRPMGSRFGMAANGGAVDAVWRVESVTIPATRVELVVNGEIRESRTLSAGEHSGHWTVKVDKSAWLALLVRGHYAGKPEIVAAHSSPVMIDVAHSPMLAAADALTILEQIEGAMAYLDTLGTRAEDEAYKRMRMVLTSAHRSLHNRMHRQGFYHDHTPVTDHH
ncbi:MAG: CehA/McbA family metallohydrolase [Anaerolineales bacterium]|nr:CehA/McbA family metallohydrolase [Anaerolineales bacterium]